MTLPNLPAGCAWPKRPSGLASQWFPCDFEGEFGSSVAYTNGACVQFSREADSHRLYALALERAIPSWLEAARREAYIDAAETCERLGLAREKHAAAFGGLSLSFRRRAAQLTPTPADARGTETE